MQPGVTSIQNETKRGRLMKPGRLVAREDIGIRYFFCYCDHCSNKILADREYLKHFMMFAMKQERSMRLRLIKYLVKKLHVTELS